MHSKMCEIKNIQKVDLMLHKILFFIFDISWQFKATLKPNDKDHKYISNSKKYIETRFLSDLYIFLLT